MNNKIEAANICIINVLGQRLKSMGMEPCNVFVEDFDPTRPVTLTIKHPNLKCDTKITLDSNLDLPDFFHVDFYSDTVKFRIVCEAVLGSTNLDVKKAIRIFTTQVVYLLNDDSSYIGDRTLSVVKNNVESAIKSVAGSDIEIKCEKIDDVTLRFTADKLKPVDIECRDGFKFMTVVKTIEYDNKSTNVLLTFGLI